MKVINAAKLVDLDSSVLSTVDGILELSFRDDRKIVSALRMYPTSGKSRSTMTGKP
ncbi:MAG: hypothetical protein KAS93_02160 [Gammaproteobacteria bacterium]|nr:hypothetical protein [Gammaproteobacteria bacterium]